MLASEYLISSTGKLNKKDKKNDSWIGLVILAILGFIGFKVKNFFLRLFGGSLIGSNSQSKSSAPKQSKYRAKDNSVVYRFRVKGTGSAGGVKYADGMNVEVAISGLGASGSPFNSTVEKLFVQEFARKYNIESRFQTGIKMLFKRENVDVEII
jgi:hypothetical protein